MKSGQILRHQQTLFRSLPKEIVIIRDTDYDCICMGARKYDEWQEGGLMDMPEITLGLDRNQFESDLPSVGVLAKFRGKNYRIKSVFVDHPQSPLRIDLESANL